MKVAVIGAGASGLAATKACLEEGFHPICYESSYSLGGLWNYQGGTVSTDPLLQQMQRGSVFESTTTIFSKELFCYSDFPLPDDFPVYLHNRHVREYLSMYADRFRVRQCIQFGVVVEYVGCAHTRVADHNRKWMLKLLELKTGKRWEQSFDAVMICTGHHSEPFIPPIKGMPNFRGSVIHTRDYKTPAGFEGKRVVVIGAGNSGADVATELSDIAAKVYLSTRRGTWLITRYQDGGIPTDILVTRRILQLIPTTLQNAFFKYKLNQAFDYEAHKLLPDNGVLSTYPTINDHLVKRIQNGLVIIKPDVLQFSSTAVQFQDGSIANDIDCIIFATGYRFNVPFLDNSILQNNNHQVPLYKHVFPVKYGSSANPPTLAFIGLVQPWGAMNPVAEIQSRWAVRIFSGASHLPATELMLKDIDRMEHFKQERFVSSERHSLNVDSIAYVDDIANQFGARPSMFRLLFQDPMLALMCIFGPCLAYQYRLRGPGSWKGATGAIRNAWSRMKQQGWVMSIEKHIIVMSLTIPFIAYILLCTE